MEVVRLPSNVVYFRDIIQNSISSSLSEDHRMALRDTPFYGYLDIPNVPMQPLLVDCLLEVFDVEKSSFKIGGKWAYFGVEDVGRITGLPMRGSIIDSRFHRSDRETIYKLVLSFRTKEEIEEDGKRRTRKGKKKIDEGKKKVVCARRDRMGELLKEMAERRDPILPQMLVAFIIGFILCPQSNWGCPLFAFRYVEKLHTLKDYNWAEVVYTVLRTEMSKAKKTITKRSEGKCSRGGYMGGFASVLVIWFYELVGMVNVRVGDESLPPILRFYKCPKSLRRSAVKELVRDPTNFRKCDNNSRALKFHGRVTEAATTKPATIKGKAITEADLDKLIHDKKVELDLLLKMKREIFGGKQEDVDSDDRNEEDDGDEEEDEEDDGDVGEGENDDGAGDEGDGGDVDEDVAGDGADVDEDVGGDAEVDGDEDERNDGDGDVDAMNLDRHDGGDDAIDEVGMFSMEVDDDAFILSPRDIPVIEGKRKTPSIKKTVLLRSRLAGPSLRSPFVPLTNRKGVPIYPGRKEVNDNERELLDNFWKDKNMTMETLVWKSNDAWLTRKDALELLKGDAISCDVIASYVVLLNMLMEEKPKYAKDIHICSPWVTILVRYQLPVVVIIFNNGGIYGGDRRNSDEITGSYKDDPPPTSVVPEAAYHTMMEAFGGKGYLVNNPIELKSALSDKEWKIAAYLTAL